MYAQARTPQRPVASSSSRRDERRDEYEPDEATLLKLGYQADHTKTQEAATLLSKLNNDPEARSVKADLKNLKWRDVNWGRELFNRYGGDNTNYFSRFEKKSTDIGKLKNASHFRLTRYLEDAKLRNTPATLADKLSSVVENEQKDVKSSQFTYWRAVESNQLEFELLKYMADQKGPTGKSKVGRLTRFMSVAPSAERLSKYGDTLVAVRGEPATMPNVNGFLEGLFAPNTRYSVTSWSKLLPDEKENVLTRSRAVIKPTQKKDLESKIGFVIRILPAK
ncbi:hypothetical protein [Burkholderia stagnalis]|nr:hypothetical protein [Burkholderia stagnalis]